MATVIVDTHGRQQVLSSRQIDGNGGLALSGAPTDHENLQEACRFCFDVLMSHFTRTPCPAPKFPDGEYPLFVTWDKYDHRGNSNLRGCIGNLSPITLHDGIKKYASVSAFQDRRFSPVADHEVKALECSVTLLYMFEEAGHYMDWQIGKHGMIIKFTSGGQALSATYLPSVCQDQGWTQLECIHSLVKKAGHNGSITQSLLNSIQLTRYQGTKATVDFLKYADNRKRNGLWLMQWGD